MSGSKISLNKHVKSDYQQNVKDNHTKEKIPKKVNLKLKTKDQSKMMNNYRKIIFFYLKKYIYMKISIVRMFNLKL